MKRAWPILPLLLLAAAAFLPGQLALPLAIEAPGMVMAQREWALVRGRDGELRTTLTNHRLGQVEAVSVVGWERGDFGAFRLHPRLGQEPAVTLGDTIGQTHSLDLERELTQVRGELAVELASLAASAAGQKESVIREARARLEQARAQADLLVREATRVEALAARELAALSALETATTAARVAILEADLAAAQLASAVTGLRAPEQELARARVSSLREDLAALTREQESSTLTAPLSGRFTSYIAGDTLCAIQDTAAYVVLIPIRWREVGRLLPGQVVELRIDGIATRPHGRIVQVERVPYRAADGRQFARVLAVVEEPTEELAPGLLVRCAVAGPRVGLFEYLRRLLAA
ncbi:MAG: hypothetical protein WDA75_19990 [Candidatus Latescibacterota bacterium]|jgi:hypothetical protein